MSRFSMNPADYYVPGPRGGGGGSRGVIRQPPNITMDDVSKMFKTFMDVARWKDMKEEQAYQRKRDETKDEQASVASQLLQQVQRLNIGKLGIDVTSSTLTLGNKIHAEMMGPNWERTRDLVRSPEFIAKHPEIAAQWENVDFLDPTTKGGAQRFLWSQPGYVNAMQMAQDLTFLNTLERSIGGTKGGDVGTNLELLASLTGESDPETIASLLKEVKSSEGVREGRRTVNEELVHRLNQQIRDVQKGMIRSYDDLTVKQVQFGLKEEIPTLGAFTGHFHHLARNIALDGDATQAQRQEALRALHAISQMSDKNVAEKYLQALADKLGDTALSINGMYHIKDAMKSQFDEISTNNATFNQQVIDENRIKLGLDNLASDKRKPGEGSFYDILRRKFGPDPNDPNRYDEALAQGRENMYETSPRFSDIFGEEATYGTIPSLPGLDELNEFGGSPLIDMTKGEVGEQITNLIPFSKPPPNNDMAKEILTGLEHQVGGGQKRDLVGGTAPEINLNNQQGKKSKPLDPSRNFITKEVIPFWTDFFSKIGSTFEDKKWHK